MTKQRYHKIRPNKNHKQKGKSFFLLFPFLVIFLVFILGISYAFFSQTLKGEKENIVKAGTLAIEYKDKKVIYMENSYPMSDDRGMMTNSYEFSVENTGDVKAIYDISLENDNTITNALNHAYIKYSIKKNDDEWSEPQVLSSLLLEKNVAIEIGGKNTYQLKLWVDEMAGNEAQDKVFKARIVVSSTQDIGQTNDVTAPTITLAGDLSISIEQNGEYSDAGVESVVDDKDTLNKEDVTVTYEYYDGETTSEVETIDTSKLGVYYIYYRISDKSGNESFVVRTVNVYKKDSTPPVITLNGESTVSVEKDGIYEELGATVEDMEDGNLTDRLVVIGEVNTKKVGSYTIKYLIIDSSFNTASIVRIVNVEDIKKYQVIYDYQTNGGQSSSMESTKVAVGGKIDFTKTAEKEDWTFIGWNTDKDAHEGLNSLVMGDSDITLYAIYRKEAVTRNVVYIKDTNVTAIGKTSDSCTIAAVYNNETQETSCNVTLPTITPLGGYNVKFWTTSATATSGAVQGRIVALTTDMTYYAKARDTVKPVWSLVSTTPSSGTIAASDTLTITFKGTDTSGSVTSTLTEANIMVKVGTTTVTPTTKKLSSASNVTDGKQYTLTLSGFSASGVISITIGSSSLKDSSNNENVATTLTTQVNSFITGPFNTTLIAKANSAGNTDGATAEQLKQPFTVTHEAGEQQSGWTTQQLTDYRYMGSTPYNYVTFNDEVWRVIGVFTVENENGKKEQRVKLIRNESLGKNYTWDNKPSGVGSSTNSNGSNEWSDSTLQIVLNSGPYYNRTSGRCPYGENNATNPCDFSSIGLTDSAKKMIGKTKWYLGALNPYDETAMSSYTLERSNTKCNNCMERSTNWIGNVGLMYPSDYGYAGGTSSCLSIKLSDYNACIRTQWLPRIYSWTISPYNEDGYSVLHVGSRANVYVTTVTSTTAASPSPSVYLKSNVLVTGGDGSSENPYQLSI